MAPGTICQLEGVHHGARKAPICQLGGAYIVNWGGQNTSRFLKNPSINIHDSCLDVGILSSPWMPVESLDACLVAGFLSTFLACLLARFLCFFI